MSGGSLTITDIGDMPVSLEAAKRHLRVAYLDDNAAIDAMIRAAVDEFERRTGRAYSQLTCELRLSCFPDSNDAITLPRPPLVEVTSIEYTDEAGDSQTLAESDYVIDASRAPAVVVPAVGTDWPDTIGTPGNVIITYSAGEPASVPKSIVHAMLVWLDKEYHEQDAPTAARLAARIDAILNQHTLRDSGLCGVLL